MQAIATSGGQNDSGMFEMDFRDERYLPFEGAGAVSRWRIEMDPDSNGFDFNTLADVVLHVRYTARDGGERLKEAAKKALAEAMGEEPQARIFSLRHEFPTDWHQLTRTQGPGPFTGTFTLTKNRFPFLFQGKGLTAGKVFLYAVLKDGVKAEAATALAVKLQPPTGDATIIKFGPKDKWLGILAPKETPEVNQEVKSAPEEAKWVLKTDPPDSPALAQTVDDLLLVCEYSVEPNR
jgi:receptor-binding and translocation channel-forming TcA subunit of Tc toxin